MHVDLHTHTTCSDGSLAPGEVVTRATQAGVELLALTDHDTLDACAHAPAGDYGALRLVSGIELSTHWRRIGIHVVGLNFDPDDAALRAAV